MRRQKHLNFLLSDKKLFDRLIKAYNLDDRDMEQEKAYFKRNGIEIYIHYSSNMPFNKVDYGNYRQNTVNLKR